jgi:hypothetical protein
VTAKKAGACLLVPSFFNKYCRVRIALVPLATARNGKVQWSVRPQRWRLSISPRSVRAVGGVCASRFNGTHIIRGSRSQIMDSWVETRERGDKAFPLPHSWVDAHPIRQPCRSLPPNDPTRVVLLIKQKNIYIEREVAAASRGSSPQRRPDPGAIRLGMAKRAPPPWPLAFVRIATASGQNGSLLLTDSHTRP